MSKLKTQSGSEVELGPLAHDLMFMIRNMQTLLRPEAQAVRGALNLEPGVIGVLSIVWLNPDISQNDLAASLVLKKSAVTKLVKSLEADGLLTRRKVSADRRRNALTLTSDGHALISEMRGLTDALHDRLFDGVAEDDRAAFFRVMFGLFSRLESQGKGGDQPK